MNETPVPQPAQHLSAETVYAYLDGRLDPPAGRAVESHLWRCDRCRTLREECAALLSSLRWYAADPPACPKGYWDDFWRRLPIGRRRRHTRRVAPALALAASVALLLWIRPVAEEPAPTSPPTVVQGPSAPSGEWASDYRLFEQATAAVGSADPLSKGIILASLAEGR